MADIRYLVVTLRKEVTDEAEAKALTAIVKQRLEDHPTIEINAMTTQRFEDEPV